MYDYFVSYASKGVRSFHYAIYFLNIGFVHKISFVRHSTVVKITTQRYHIKMTRYGNEAYEEVFDSSVDGWYSMFRYDNGEIA